MLIIAIIYNFKVVQVEFRKGIVFSMVYIMTETGVQLSQVENPTYKGRSKTGT